MLKLRELKSCNGAAGQLTTDHETAGNGTTPGGVRGICSLGMVKTCDWQKVVKNSQYTQERVVLVQFQTPQWVASGKPVGSQWVA